MFNLIDGFINRHGVWGVFVLMLVENLLPVIPSEIILPFAGFEAAKGAFSPYGAVLAATAGSALGGCVWYEIGRRFGLARALRWSEHSGRWTTITPSEIGKGYAWVQRWGSWVVFLRPDAARGTQFHLHPRRDCATKTPGVFGVVGGGRDVLVGHPCGGWLYIESQLRNGARLDRSRPLRLHGHVFGRLRVALDQALGQGLMA